MDLSDPSEEIPYLKAGSRISELSSYFYKVTRIKLLPY
jgi:hypothetical protein